MHKKNPIYEKELWSSGRSTPFAAVVIGFHLVMAVIALTVFSNMLRYIESHSQGNYAVMLQLYIVLAMVVCMILVCVMPGMAGSGISQERERRTFELMCVSGVSPAQLVLGKFFAYMNTAVVLVLAGMPALFLVFVYGGIQIWDILWMGVVLLVIAGYTDAVSLFCSAAVKKTGHALVAAYGVNLLLSGGTLVLHYYPLLLFGETYGEEIGSTIAWYHYLLLWNPVVTFYDVLNQQAGSREFLFDMINYQGNYRPNWITENWTLVSLGCQILTAAIMLAAAVRILKKKR